MVMLAFRHTKMFQSTAAFQQCSCRTALLCASAMNRRLLLASSCSTAGFLAHGKASANMLDTVARQLIRGTMSHQDAAVALMDAISVLEAVEALAESPMDSAERMNARSLLPSIAKRLRDVGPAVAAVSGASSETVDVQLSGRYGGVRIADSQPALAEQVLLAVGRVLTISGRTLKPEALAEGTQLPYAAKAAIIELVTSLPQELQDKAEQARAERQKVSRH